MTRITDSPCVHGMDPGLSLESERLRWSWDRYPAETLDGYLVKDHEDPRINCQSILTRAMIIDTLWPDEFGELISEELRFGAVLCWVIQQLHSGGDRYALIDEIVGGSEDVPAFVLDTASWLERSDCVICDYIMSTLWETDPDCCEQVLGVCALNTFRDVWSDVLRAKSAPPLSVMEIACGSANDYRFIDSFGLNPFIAYAGFDISRKNIENAQRRFPGTRFMVGNVLEVGLVMHDADYVFIHDLFEHLSPGALDVALEQTMSLCRKEAWLHFFNLADIPGHRFHRVDAYYWNVLSLGQIVETVERHCSQVEVISIKDMVRTKFGWDDYYNREAVTILATK